MAKNNMDILLGNILGSAAISPDNKTVEQTPETKPIPKQEKRSVKAERKEQLDNSYMMIFMARNQFTPGTGSEIRGKRLGIQAYGHVGRLVGRLGKAMGMEVSAHDPYVNPEVFAEDGVMAVDSVEALYEQSDFLSLHIPATEQTKGSIGYSLLSKMPKGATLVNTARKEVIDEAGLAQALEERPDLKYITDIAAGNQAELNEKFGKRVFATAKKMGAETAEANINAGLAAARQVVAYFKENDTRFQVNK